MTEVDNKGGIEFLNLKREWVSAVMLMRERVGLCKRLKREIESLQWTWLEWRIEEREWVSALNIMRGMGSLCSGHDWSGDTERDWVSLVSLCSEYVDLHCWNKREIAELTADIMSSLQISWAHSRSHTNFQNFCLISLQGGNFWIFFCIKGYKVLLYLIRIGLEKFWRIFQKKTLRGIELCGGEPAVSSAVFSKSCSKPTAHRRSEPRWSPRAYNCFQIPPRTACSRDIQLWISWVLR